MADELKSALATLGATSLAEVAGRLAVLAKLEQATGKTGDEAHGVVLAWKASHAKVDELQKSNADLQKQVDDGELETAIKEAKASNKLTPAEETTLREQVANKDISIKGAKAMLTAKSPIQAFVAGASGSKPKTEQTAAAESGAPTWNGKTWAELKGSQRAELLKENPELYAQLRDAALS